MTSVQRGFSQQSPLTNLLITRIDTMWIYPKADLLYALQNTSYQYQFDGFNIICPDINNLSGVYDAVYTRTTVTQPVGNVGYSLGVGTLLQDIGQKIEWKLSSGEVVVRWTLVKQLTSQAKAPNNKIPTPGDSPDETIGYCPIFISFPNNTLTNGLAEYSFVSRLG
jgi:hypothetical protein